MIEARRVHDERVAMLQWAFRMFLRQESADPRRLCPKVPSQPTPSRNDRNENPRSYTSIGFQTFCDVQTFRETFGFCFAARRRPSRAPTFARSKRRDACVCVCALYARQNATLPRHATRAHEAATREGSREGSSSSSSSSIVSIVSIVSRRAGADAGADGSAAATSFTDRGPWSPWSTLTCCS